MDRRQFLIGGGTLAALGAGTWYVGAKQMGSSSDYDEAAKSMRAML